MSAASARLETLNQLRRHLSGSQHHSERTIVSTGFHGLDQLLPQQGLPCGSLVEWISDVSGIRTGSIVLKCAAQLLQKPGAMAVVDPLHQFHPASAGHLGIPLSRLLLVRPGASTVSQRVNTTTEYLPSQTQRSDALWALEQLARCSGVRVILTWIDRMSSTAHRRLQLAVENSGVTVFMIRPPQAIRQTSWADLRLLVQSTAVTSQRSVQSSQEPSQLISVRLLRSKNSVQHQGSLLLECDDETSDVFETAELANSTAATSAAR